MKPRTVEAFPTDCRRVDSISRMNGRLLSGSSSVLICRTASRLRQHNHHAYDMPRRLLAYSFCPCTVTRCVFTTFASVDGHAHLLTGEEMIGPLPLTTSNSIPRAGNGVRMSLNMITPSGLNASQGCNDSSMAMLAVSERSLNGILSEYLQRRKARLAVCLPTCTQHEPRALGLCRRVLLTF